MFITKSEPVVTNNGKIKENIEIKGNELLINDTEKGVKLKYSEGKWFTFGDDEKWYYLGLGANPCYETDDDGILNQNLFDNVFEYVDNE